MTDEELRQQYAAQQKELHALKMKNSGRPEDLTFNSNLNEDGTINDALKLTNNTNTSFLDNMRTEGLRGPGEASAWRGLMDQSITREAGDSMQQLAGAQQQGMDQMAMRGGVSSGARERMMNAGVGQNLQNQQNIFGNRLKADMQDETNRLGSLQALGQAEMNFGTQQNQVDSQNIASAQNETTQNRAFDSNMYNEKMRAWAAEKTAAATPSSSGGKK